jgi:D-3-phosphoglycerate dehydrogenase
MSAVIRVFLTHNPEDLDAYFGRSLAPLRAVASVVCNPLDHDLTTPELIEAAADCDVIVAHRATPGEAPLFSRSPRLAAFLRTAVDISTIDVEAASGAGVVVGHADKSFVTSTAELALALMLDVARNVSESTVEYRQGDSPAQRSGRQLSGRTAGIIGLGAIGSHLAAMLVSLGMDVVANDPYLDLGDEIRGVTMTGFDELLAIADFVLPLAPAMPETTHLIDADALATMKPGAILINVSRGELLDEVAVGAALDAGRLGGLGMDVGSGPDQRPAPALAARAGVVSTPHLGGLTPENADAQAASSVEQVAAIISGAIPPRVVNPASTTRLEALWARAAG